MDMQIVRRGKKNDGKVYYYKEGNEFESVTGGWVEGVKEGNSTLSKEVNFLFLDTGDESNDVQCAFVTDVVVNLSQVKKIKTLCFLEGLGSSINNGVFYIVVSEIKNGDNSDFIAKKTEPVSPGETFVGTLELDVDNLNGDYYIRLHVRNPGTTNRQTKAKIYKLWGEK